MGRESLPGRDHDERVHLCLRIEWPAMYSVRHPYAIRSQFGVGDAEQLEHLMALLLRLRVLDLLKRRRRYVGERGERDDHFDGGAVADAVSDHVRRVPVDG